MLITEFVPRNIYNITFQSQKGWLNFRGQSIRTFTCTWTCNRYTYTRTHTDVDSKPILEHCLDLTLGINAVWSILLASLTSHTPAAVKTMPVAQIDVYVYLESHQKDFGFDSKVLASLYSSPTWALSMFQHVSSYSWFPCRGFFSFVLCSVIFFYSSTSCFPSLWKSFAATAQGCIHQSSQGTTVNWFANRISLLPAISLHYDFS